MRPHTGRQLPELEEPDGPWQVGVLFGDRKLLSALDGQKVHQPSMASRVPQTLIAACMYVVVLFDLDFSARTAVHLPGGCPAGRAPATMRRTEILFCSCMCPAIACLCPSQPRVPSWLWAAHVLYRPPLLMRMRMLGQAGCSRSECGCIHSSQQTGRQLPRKSSQQQCKQAITGHMQLQIEDLLMVAGALLARYPPGRPWAVLAVQGKVNSAPTYR